MPIWVLVLPLFIASCVSAQQVLKPAANVPSTCEEIDAEMLALADSHGKWLVAGEAKDGAAFGVGLAAAAGALPSGFSWAPLAAMVAQKIGVPDYSGRINYLANIREMRGCPPLVFAETEEGDSEL